MRIALNGAEEEAALSRMVGDITLDDGSSSGEDVVVHRERSRRARRLHQGHNNNLRRPKSKSPNININGIIHRGMPANVRTLCVWGCVGLMLPLLTGASPAMRCVLAFACILRYLANLRALCTVLKRCISSNNKSIPVGTILTWELWAPRRFSRAFLALIPTIFAICVTAVVSLLFIDLCVEVLNSDSIRALM